MNICILSSRFPYPEIGGDSLRINHVAKHLKKEGHRLILVSFYGEKTPDIEMAETLYDKVVMLKWSPMEAVFFSFLYLLRFKPIQVGYYYSPRMLDRLRSLVRDEKIDLFIPHAMRMTEYVAKLGLENYTIVEQTDAMSKTYKLSKKGKGSTLKNIMYRVESVLIPRYEEYMLRTFPKVVYVSPSDVSYLQEKYPWQKAAAYHTNGFNVPDRVVEHYNPFKICLMGNMRTLQNQDAALFFVKEVLPLVVEKEPQTVFYIVGAEPSKQIQELASENIIVTGFVNRVEDVISDACLCVAPVRIAAGIQNKVLVSMGCGVPVVMSSLVSQPIPELINGENCFIEDNPVSIAELCLNLMNDKKKRNSIGRNGRQLIIDSYSWNKTLNGYLMINRNAI